ncbi:MAG TPA: sugar nucleotide-binding protein, partial [Stellaceae bacterium]|nr:sugar nucleotide-binding protein [Stellaceae bacterium]
FPAVATTRRGERLGDGRVFLDLAPPLAEWQPPADTRAACIFAAVGHLVDCQRDPVGSALINVTRTVELVERLVARKVYVLFLSTNQVFDGSRPQVPVATPLGPVSEYGRQKARTETRLQAMTAAGAPVGILRLAKIVAPGMALLRQWQEALAAGRPVHAFHDMVMAPTPIGVAAAAITALLAERCSGIWQLTGPRDISYAEVAAYIARRLDADRALVRPVAAAGMPEGSTPRNTTLDSSALRARFGIATPAPWPTIEGVLPPSETTSPAK